MSKFALAFGSVFLFFFFWAGILLLGGIIMKNVEEGVGLAIIGVAVLGFVIGLLPFMQWVSGAIFSYEDETITTHLTEQELRERLIEINVHDTPIQVLERGDRLIVTWNYVNAEWWNVLSRSSMNKVYELHLKFDADNQTVTLIDVHKSVRWQAGPDQVSLHGGFSRGVDLSYERTVAYGWDDAFEFGRVIDYEFKNTDIKDPVVNLIVESGWRAKFGLW